MRLIVGLGNPGESYENTLHNVGFAAIDSFFKATKPGNWTNKHKGLLAKGQLKGADFLLLKPQTYMNVSGESVLSCKQFYKIEIEDILVVSDDIDRPAGTLRYRTSGGHGGHNGLRSIIQLCGTNQFHRIKIGIGRPDNSAMKIADYVLSKPSDEVKKVVGQAIDESTQYMMDFILGAPIHIKPAD